MNEVRDIVGAVETVTVCELNEMLSQFDEQFDSTITLGNVVDAVIILMKIISTFKKIPGRDKKQIVISLILIKSKENLDDTMEAIVCSIVPVVIDKLINVENGQLVFNKKIKYCCFGK